MSFPLWVSIINNTFVFYVNNITRKIKQGCYDKQPFLFSTVQLIQQFQFLLRNKRAKELQDIYKSHLSYSV